MVLSEIDSDAAPELSGRQCQSAEGIAAGRKAEFSACRGFLKD
jgi:hypothetical protein